MADVSRGLLQAGNSAGESHLSDGAEDLLLMRVHLCEGADLSQVDVLSVAKCYNFVKGKDQVETVLRNLAFLQNATVFRDLRNNPGE